MALGPPLRLLWAEAGWEEADVVVAGIPYDGTTSFRPGARFGPTAIRQASVGLELYSPLIGRSVDPARVHDAGDLELTTGRPDGMLAAGEAFTGAVLDAGKTPMLLGGEHGVTLGPLRAAARRHPGLVLLQFDAHADLRTDYLGERYSHAAVMYHAQELLGAERVFQLGIRSGEAEEFGRARHLRPDLEVEAFVEAIGERPVYLTVDIDVLDPAFAPGTGTPEPGGVTAAEAIQAVVRAVEALHVVAADLVEVAPAYDPAGITALAAAKILREVTVALLRRKGR